MPQVLAVAMAALEARRRGRLGLVLLVRHTLDLKKRRAMESVGRAALVGECCNTRPNFPGGWVVDTDLGEVQRLVGLLSAEDIR